MPSFDVVSEIDQHELRNAIDQMNREIGTRYDFKGSNAKIDVTSDALNVEAESEFQITQIEEIIYSKLAKLGIDTRCLEKGKIEERGKRAYQRRRAMAEDGRGRRCAGGRGGAARHPERSRGSATARGKHRACAGATDHRRRRGTTGS